MQYRIIRDDVYCTIMLYVVVLIHRAACMGTAGLARTPAPAGMLQVMHRWYHTVQHCHKTRSYIFRVVVRSATQPPRPMRS